jgi:hypothetical protein
MCQRIAEINVCEALIQPVRGGGGLPRTRPGSRTSSQRSPRWSSLSASTGNTVRSPVIGRLASTSATRLRLALGPLRTLWAVNKATIRCVGETRGLASPCSACVPVNKMQTKVTTSGFIWLSARLRWQCSTPCCLVVQPVNPLAPRGCCVGCGVGRVAAAQARNRRWSVAAGVLSLNVTRAVTNRSPALGAIQASNGELLRVATSRFPTEKVTRRIKSPVTVARNGPCTQRLVPNLATS